MALRGTLTHRKTRRLAKELGICPCYALGILEALWHVTSEQCPDGAIGQMKNADIADEMFYRGNADRLISALLKCGLLDESTQHRLVVHDWSKHADQATKRKLERRKLCLVNGDSCLAMTSLPEPVPEPVPGLNPPNPLLEKGGTVISNSRKSRRQPQADVIDEMHAADKAKRGGKA